MSATKQLLQDPHEVRTPVCNSRQPVLVHVLTKTGRAQACNMEMDRFRQLTADIRDDLAVVRLLQKVFAIERSDIPPRLHGRSDRLDRQLKAAHTEICDIAEAASKLNEDPSRTVVDSQTALEMLIARVANVHTELCLIDEEEGEILFEAFWQDLGVGD